ncbi:patatin-like phospholipase [Klosneuvirus KNV1]|uniref:Patatin-like phospholipase n=1 Tax=Klosneuvirus KNV1 TaxID=1977640 RepID=A0A1V0SKV5_9VIRU|nr:patatin-like phospholipase [Klosneuvirus KNV1]
MGLDNSKYYLERDAEILSLKNKVKKLNEFINVQEDRITLLKTELDAIRQLDTFNGVGDDLMKEINTTFVNRDYEYLVFSGGGIKGLSFVGALETLEKLEVLYDEKRQLKLKGIAATSAGSIIGSLFAVGYKPHELRIIIDGIDFKQIVDDKPGFIRDGINFLEDWGVCPGNYIREVLGDLIKQKTGNPDYTFDDLYHDKKIKLVIVATEMSNEKSIYFYSGHPDKKYSNIPIREAVRMSMGIPFMFEPCLYNDGIFVDGGVLDNYPLHVFDGDYPGDPIARINECKPNPKVLGINIMSSSDQINYDIVEKEKITSLYQYGYSFVNTFLTENERRIMTPSFWLRSIILITPNYSLTTFDLTNEQKTQLVDIGMKGVNDYFVKKSKELMLSKK